MTRPRTSRWTALAALAVAPLAVTALTVPTSDAAPKPKHHPHQEWFSRTATYPVFQNVPAGVDPAEETVAEISSVTEDGTTVVYTDAAGGRIGFVDIRNPNRPKGLGSYELAEGDEPTSVAAVGDYVFVVIDTSESFTDPSGRLDVIRFSDHSLVTSIDLGGQPDSIAISPDGGYAAVAIENERDEDHPPDGLEEGDLPQAPAGFVQTIDLAGDPSGWSAEPVLLEASDLPGITAPTDAEPEYVDIDDDNQLVVTLQENNGIVTVDLASLEITAAFSAGEATVESVDTDDDGVFDLSDTITVPREPDAVQWVGPDLVATADEGDWLGGSRGWTVFDVSTGEPVWEAGNSFEHLAVEYGLFNDSRADNKGAEPEGIAFGELGGTPYAFVGSERSNFVAVYDMTDPRNPAFEQVLPTTNGPEGLLPVPGRDLLIVSSEEDSAEHGVRATVGVYKLGRKKPKFPSTVSATEPGASAPIGWGALGALSAAPGEPERAYAASDSAYATGRIYAVDLSRRPAVIDGVTEVTESDGEPADVDIEGLAARADGGVWVASEGATGPENRLLRTDADGVVQETVSLPDDIADRLDKWGLEGVSVHGAGDEETLYVALQRPLAGEERARIGRYVPATGAWTWFGYRLETTDVDGDWIGLSEIVAIDDDTVAVIERDKQVGTAAAIKQVATVDLPVGTTGEVTPVEKELAVDVLPEMQGLRGWTQEKLEGLAVTDGGRLIAVTDNDGVDDATGETQLLDLGAVERLLD